MKKFLIRKCVEQICPRPPPLDLCHSRILNYSNCTVVYLAKQSVCSTYINRKQNAHGGGIALFNLASGFQCGVY